MKIFAKPGDHKSGSGTGRTICISVLIISILLRFVMYCFQDDPAGDDRGRYVTEATNVLRYRVFSDVDVQGAEIPPPTTHDTPLYPLMLALFMWVGGSFSAAIWILGFVHILFFSAGAVGFLKILKNPPFELNDAAMFWPICIFCLMPGAVVHSMFNLPDQIAMTWLIWAMFFYFRMIYRDSSGDAAASAFMFSVAVLTKPICLMMAIAYFAIMPFIRKVAVKRRLLHSAVAALVVVLMLMPWLIRNRLSIGHYALTTITGTNLYTCNWQWMTKTWPEAERRAAEAEDIEFERSIAGLDTVSYSNARRDYAVRQILAHWKEYLVFLVKTHPRLYVGTGNLAFCRYLGLRRPLEKLEEVLDDPRNTFKSTEHFLLMVLPLIWLGVCYAVVVFGIVRAGVFLLGKKVVTDESEFSKYKISFACGLCSLLLIALLLGPVVTTRYRFMMIPFFSILASFAVRDTPKSAADPVERDS